MALTPTGLALSLVLVSIIFLVLSWITTLARLSVRRKIKGIGLDDWLMVAGLLIFTVLCATAIVAAYNGVGTPSRYLDAYYTVQGGKWLTIAQLCYVLSTVPIKASICFALIRITTNAVYRWILYGVIALATMACIITDVTILTWCQPVSANWDPSAGKCADPSVLTNVSYFISAVSILTDWTCAVLPALILWDVKLRLGVKLSLIGVLALGFVASTATIVRIRYLIAFNSSEEYLLNVANVAIWSIIESGTGIIAGSLASLRPLLKYIPFLRDYSSGRTPHSGKTGQRPGDSYKMDSMRYTHAGAQQTTCKASGDNNWDRLSDTESQKHILNDHTIRVTKDIVLES
ncbi:hypothetical protein JX265_012900 [Neoarthrinium moseri]|uniref:Rhodopsin domain-containing protein n=1 Tax=Neoarthrinium moseri TaxID=1658444 RepID=A0A9P9W9S6_9PEZI|nr:hypothetical protein JX265_012900 [Neoarthrinium moseri]